MACREDPDIGRRGSLSGKKATITHGLAGTTRQRSQTSQFEERRTFTSSKPTTTTRAPSNIPENSRSSSFEEPAGLVEEDYYFFSEEEEEEKALDPFTKDPSKFLFVPGIQESRKGVEEASSESNNFGLDRSRPEEEFGRKIDSSSAAVLQQQQQQGRFQPQGLNSPGISFNEEGESNLFDVLSQLDL